MIDSMYERVGQRADLYQQLLAMLNGGQVSRYHTIPTLRTQTVASHSYSVAWLCYFLAHEQPSTNLLMAALGHDLPEQVLGDIPSPAKWRFGISDTFTAAEEAFLEDNAIRFNLTPAEQRILKLADRLDLILYCTAERALGNLHTVPIVQRVVALLTGTELTGREAALYENVMKLWRSANHA